MNSVPGGSASTLYLDDECSAGLHRVVGLHGVLGLHGVVGLHGVLGLHRVFAALNCCSGDDAGVLDLIKENGEEGPRGSKS